MAQVSQVMKMSITRYEFAQALGMKHTDLFVEKMFRIIDRDKDGKISFQEFLETVTRFSMPQASADQTNQVRTLNHTLKKETCFNIFGAELFL